MPRQIDHDVGADAAATTLQIPPRLTEAGVDRVVGIAPFDPYVHLRTLATLVPEYAWCRRRQSTPNTRPGRPVAGL